MIKIKLSKEKADAITFTSSWWVSRNGKRIRVDDNGKEITKGEL